MTALTSAMVDGAEGTAVPEVYARLRRDILTGAMRSGTPFSQVKLAAQLGVSRTPLREALRLLEREGLVESAPNRMTRVPQIRAEDIDDLYGTRILVECLALAGSMSVARPESRLLVMRLVDEMDQLASTRDTLTWEIPHAAFHAELLAGSGHRLVDICTDLRDHSQMYRTRVLAEPLAWSVASLEHREIAGSFVDGDVVGATSALARHYARTSLALITQLDPAYDPVGIRTALRAALNGSWLP